jgi:hypothetical protein
MSLDGWNENQKLKLTIDSSKVDGDLTNFPVNITLSSGTGQTGFDATAVFDELLAISSTKNIAITDSNDNQLYIEIERWDWENEEANLWVKVPTIASGTDTNLYLYYDTTVSGNITYVGDTGDTPAQNVWDDNFVGVWHMSQNPKPWNVYSYNTGFGPEFVFDENNTGGSFWEISTSVFPNWAEYEFGLNKRIIVEYAVCAGDSVPERMPKDWTFRGSNNYTDWDILDTQTGQSFIASQTKTYSFSNSTPYRYYRVYITAGNNAVLRLFGLEFRESIGGPNVAIARDVILDSTSNANNGVPTNTMTPDDSVDSVIGKGIDFDGVDDVIDFGASDVLDDITNITVEACVYKPGDISANPVFMGKGTTNKGWHIMMRETAAPTYSFCSLSYFTPGQLNAWASDASTWLNATQYIFAMTYSNTSTANDPIYYIDGTPVNVNDLATSGAAYDSDAAYDFFIGAWNVDNNPANATGFFKGVVEEVRLSNIIRSEEWIKATYYSNKNNLITFNEAEVIIFNFSNPVPTDLAKAYGTTTQLYLTTTVSGPAPSYIYDAVFYDAYNDSIINTASGIQSEQPAGVIMSTPSGIDYQWYVTATSSGSEDTSDTYTFTNKFLCEGQTQINNVPASGIPVRLYRRSTGEYIGGVISSGVSGTFEIETDYNEYHYAIALYTSDDTNAIISDWLTPNN